jgi:hypothetical protein
MKINFIHFAAEPIEVVIILALSFIFIIFLFFLDRKRPSLLQFSISIAIAILLALIGLKPQLKTKNQGTNALMLTPNYSQEIVKKLLKENGIKSVFANWQVTSLKGPNISPVRDLYLHNIDTLYIVGDGVGYLPEDLNVNFIKPLLNPDEEGFTDMIYEQNLYVNDIGLLKGFYAHKSDFPVTIYMGINDIILDSSVVETRGIHDIELKFPVTQVGKTHYTIKVIDKKDTLIKEVLPVNVMKPAKKNILFVEEYPSFETKYLKDFLAEQGHGLVSRIKVSKEKFIIDFVNREQTDLKSLSKNALQKFDMVIMSGFTFSKLSNKEKEGLEAYVKEFAGNLLVFADENLEKYLNFFSTALDIKSVTIGQEKYVILDKNKIPVKLKGVVYNKNTNSLSWKLTGTSQSEIISQYSILEKGMVGISFPEDTYSLVLEGNEDKYRTLWTNIFKGFIKEQVKKKVMPGKLLFTNHQSIIRLNNVSGNDELFFLQQNNKVYEDVYLPERSISNLTFREPGWKEILVNDSLIGQTIFIHTDTAWHNIQKQGIKNSTLDFVEKHNKNKESKQSTIYDRKFFSVNFLLLFLIIIALCSILWILQLKKHN